MTTAIQINPRQKALDKLFLILQTQQYIKDRIPVQYLNIGNLKNYIDETEQESYWLTLTYDLPPNDSSELLDNFLEVEISVPDDMIRVEISKTQARIDPDTKDESIPDFEGDVVFFTVYIKEFNIRPESGILGLLEVFDLLRKEFNR